jgi:hypothetical protein
LELTIMQNKFKFLAVSAVVAFSAISAQAAPTTIAAADNPTSSTVAAAALGGYVVNAFNFTPSRGVALSADGGPTAMGVSTANTKGRSMFGGSSQGGSVQLCTSTTGSAVPVPVAPVFNATSGMSITGCVLGS